MVTRCPMLQVLQAVLHQTESNRQHLSLLNRFQLLQVVQVKAQDINNLARVHHRSNLKEKALLR